METFKFAIFALELAGLPEDIRLAKAIGEAFDKLPLAKDTLFQTAGSIDEAASTIDQFKSKTCGSAYSVAVLNLNQLNQPEELSFLLSRDVLGDPRTIFLATLRGIQGPVYSIASEKVEREAGAIAQGKRNGAPSCIESYNTGGRAESSQRIAEILNALLVEEEQRAKTKQTGVFVPHILSRAHDLMRKTTSIYCGYRPGKTALMGLPSQSKSAKRK